MFFPLVSKLLLEKCHDWSLFLLFLSVFYEKNKKEDAPLAHPPQGIKKKFLLVAYIGISS